MQKIHRNAKSTSSSILAVKPLKNVKMDIGNLLKTSKFDKDTKMLSKFPSSRNSMKDIKEINKKPKRISSVPQYTRRKFKILENSISKRDPIVLNIIDKKKLMTPQKTNHCVIPLKTRSEEERYKQTQILILQLKRNARNPEENPFFVIDVFF